MVNKVKYGLKNVHYSKITVDETGKYTYATPVAIEGSVSLSGSASGDSSDFYADDVIYYSSSANQGYEGELECAMLPDTFLTDILGETKDTNGALIENADATISNFALGFEVQGDSKGRRTWYYNCIATRPNQDASTTESSKTPATQKLSIKMMPRKSDKQVKATMTLDETNTATYNAYFSKVYDGTTVTGA